MKLMLLEDYRYGAIPKSVANILGFLQKQKVPPSKNDIIVAFLYILMLEMGFVDKDCREIVEDSDFNFQRVLRLSKTLPEGWRTSTSYQLHFILKSAPEIITSITCVTVSDDLLINCTVKNLANLSLLVDPLAYFTRFDVDLYKPNFQILDHLAMTFKNTIAFPAKVNIVNFGGGVCGCLQHLPHELLVKIMSYLGIENALVLTKTCRDMCEAALDPTLWVKLLDASFRKKNVVKSYGELKFIYEIKYARELEKMLDRTRH